MSSSKDLAMLDGINNLYAKHKPLFTYGVLEDINSHMQQGKQSVFIPSYVGEGKENSLMVDEDYHSWCSEE